MSMAEFFAVCERVGFPRSWWPGLWAWGEAEAGRG